MKVNKITVWICVAATLIFTACTFILDAYTLKMLSNICANIFTGFFVSGVVTLVGYFNEKAKILYSAEINLRQIYINMLCIKEKTGRILSQISVAQLYEKPGFNLLDDLVRLNCKLSNEIDSGLYCGFFHSGTSCFMERLEKYKSSLINLRNIESDLHIMALEHDVLSMEHCNLNFRGQFPNNEEISRLTELKNQILIRTAKIHEYEASLCIECDALLELYYRIKNTKKNWGEEKLYLNAMARDALK